MTNIKARIHKHTSEDMAELGRRCIKLRDKEHLSVTCIAERYGVTYNAVKRWIEKVKDCEEDED